MILLGFILEYDQVYGAVPAKCFLAAESKLDFDVVKTIDYLNRGVCVFAWMGYILDFETKQPIEPNAYFTDGTWLWRSYLPYYLKQNSKAALDPFFIKHLIENNYEFPKGDLTAVARKFEHELLKSFNVS